MKSGGNDFNEDEKTDKSTGQTGDEGSELLDRLAAEVNHLNFLVAQCEGATLLDSFKPVCLQI